MALKLVKDTKDYNEYYNEYLEPKSPFDSIQDSEDLMWKIDGEEYFLDKKNTTLEIDLNGQWDLKSEPSLESIEKYIKNNDAWCDSISVKIPCTVQTALYNAGLIKDPMIDKNNLDIEWIAEKYWYLRKTFTVPLELKGKRLELVFAGIDYKCKIWLNSHLLGEHEGMFGGPDFEVEDIVFLGNEKNQLIVLLEPSPCLEQHPDYGGVSRSLKAGFGFGWHYVKLLTLGIWQPVYLKIRGDAYFNSSPFMTTHKIDEDAADTQLVLDISNIGTDIKYSKVIMSLHPKNFTGNIFTVEVDVLLKPGENKFCYRKRFDNIGVWWPHSMGAPNLYTFSCTIIEKDKVCDFYSGNFGFRTIELEPTAEGPKPYLYNWQFVINGRKHWVKGANWCSPDALLRLGREKYERYLKLAMNANIELLRAWGLGLVETDAFYDLCDELGIIVWQEFPIGGAHMTDEISLELAEDMTKYVVPRLRNRPSLAVWCGANEMYLIPQINGKGEILTYLGKRCYELDGTRSYRKTCPYGGDVHTYNVYWNNHPIIDYRKTSDDVHFGFAPHSEEIVGGAIAVTEWGLSSPANMGTWKRIIPEDEINRWPLKRDGLFVHHTPTFEPRHIDIMLRYANELIPVSRFEDLIIGMQIAQGMGYKYMIEQMRAKKPNTTTTFFYKLTENYPGCSWAVIDYFGAVKRSYYEVRNAYSPVHAMVLYNQWNMGCENNSMEIFAVNDTQSDIMGEISYKIYNHLLQCIEFKGFSMNISCNVSVKVTDIELDNEKLDNNVFFIVTEIKDKSGFLNRNWYYFNFDGHPEKLWNRPKSSILPQFSRSNENYILSVKNTGKVPIIGLYIDTCEAADTFFTDDNNLLLEPGEVKEINIIKTVPVESIEHELKEIKISANNLDEYIFVV